MLWASAILRTLVRVHNSPSICLGKRPGVFSEKTKQAENPSQISAHHKVHILAASHWKQFFRLQCTILILSKELGVGSTSSRFGGGFLYLDERLRKPKTQPYPTPQRLWCIQWQSVRLKVMFDVGILLDKNTSPNGCLLSSWLSKSLRSHWGKYGITCHWQISSKLLPSSMVTGKLMYFVVIHSSSSTSSVPPGAMIH